MDLVVSFASQPNFRPGKDHHVKIEQGAGCGISEKRKNSEPCRTSDHDFINVTKSVVICVTGS